MVRFPGCPDCGTTSDAHAITCHWLDRDTPAKLAERVEKRKDRYLPPVFTRRDLLDSEGMKDFKIPSSRGNIRDAYEGPRVAALVDVFGQLEAMNLGRPDRD